MFWYFFHMLLIFWGQEIEVLCHEACLSVSLSHHNSGTVFAIQIISEVEFWKNRVYENRGISPPFFFLGGGARFWSFLWKTKWIFQLFEFEPSSVHLIISQKMHVHRNSRICCWLEFKSPIWDWVTFCHFSLNVAYESNQRNLYYSKTFL